MSRRIFNRRVTRTLWLRIQGYSWQSFAPLPACHTSISSVHDIPRRTSSSVEVEASPTAATAFLETRQFIDLYRVHGASRPFSGLVGVCRQRHSRYRVMNISKFQQNPFLVIVLSQLVIKSVGRSVVARYQYTRGYLGL